MTIIDKANAAQRLKTNPDFIDLMADIEAEVFHAFRTTNIGDIDKLQGIHTLSHGLKLVNSRIDKYIEQARYESAQNDETENDNL